MRTAVYSNQNPVATYGGASVMQKEPPKVTRNSSVTKTNLTEPTREGAHQEFIKFQNKAKKIEEQRKAFARKIGTHSRLVTMDHSRVESFSQRRSRARSAGNSQSHSHAHSDAHLRTWGRSLPSQPTTSWKHEQGGVMTTLGYRPIANVTIHGWQVKKPQMIGANEDVSEVAISVQEICGSSSGNRCMEKRSESDITDPSGCRLNNGDECGQQEGASVDSPANHPGHVNSDDHLISLPGRLEVCQDASAVACEEGTGVAQVSQKLVSPNSPYTVISNSSECHSIHSERIRVESGAARMEYESEVESASIPSQSMPEPEPERQMKPIEEVEQDCHSSSFANPSSSPSMHDHSASLELSLSSTPSKQQGFTISSAVEGELATLQEELRRTADQLKQCFTPGYKDPGGTPPADPIEGLARTLSGVDFILWTQLRERINLLSMQIDVLLPLQTDLEPPHSVQQLHNAKLCIEHDAKHEACFLWDELVKRNDLIKLQAAEIQSVRAELEAGESLVRVLSAEVWSLKGNGQDHQECSESLESGGSTLPITERHCPSLIPESQHDSEAQTEVTELDVATSPSLRAPGSGQDHQECSESLESGGRTLPITEPHCPSLIPESGHDSEAQTEVTELDVATSPSLRAPGSALDKDVQGPGIGVLTDAQIADLCNAASTGGKEGKELLRRFLTVCGVAGSSQDKEAMAAGCLSPPAPLPPTETPRPKTPKEPCKLGNADSDLLSSSVGSGQCKTNDAHVQACQSAQLSDNETKEDSRPAEKVILTPTAHRTLLNKVITRQIIRPEISSRQSDQTAGASGVRPGRIVTSLQARSSGPSVRSFSSPAFSVTVPRPLSPRETGMLAVQPQTIVRPGVTVRTRSAPPLPAHAGIQPIVTVAASPPMDQSSSASIACSATNARASIVRSVSPVSGTVRKSVSPVLHKTIVYGPYHRQLTPRRVARSPGSAAALTRTNDPSLAQTGAATPPVAAVTTDGVLRFQRVMIRTNSPYRSKNNGEGADSTSGATVPNQTGADVTVRRVTPRV